MTGIHLRHNQLADLEPIAKRCVADALLSLGLNKNISIEEMNDKDLNVLNESYCWESQICRETKCLHKCYAMITLSGVWLWADGQSQY